MNPLDKSKKRILGSMLPQYMGQSVCLLGSLVQLEPNGRVLKMKTSDEQLITVQLQQPREAKMKIINLNPKDPDMFQTELTAPRWEFILKNFETFIQMYKSQGPTFWLRFLISFKIHTEEKVSTSKKWITLLVHYQHQFIKVLNYIYVCIHKKFLESSNTAIKKFIHNLINLALTAPSYLNCSFDNWIAYLKSSKQLQTIFQNISGILEPCEYGAYTVLIYAVYIDFLSALCSVFEQWSDKVDISEDEAKKVDSKIIYWLPPFNVDNKSKPICFEKYLLDYWKTDLQRMLLTDNIHDIFSGHDTSGCCEKYMKEKNLINVFQFPTKHAMELLKLMHDEESMYTEEDSDTPTITEVCLQDICILKPHAKLCTNHKNCYVKILHDENCFEPFLCIGSSPCNLTCENNSKSLKKEQKAGKFWKNVSVEKFSVDKNKCDASTSAESYNKYIETYLHLKETIDMDVPLSVLKHTYQCMSEFHNFDFNPRRTECLNRLRKKLTLKHPTNSYQFNFKHPFYRESLLENAECKFNQLQLQACYEKCQNCEGKCSLRNTIAISSSNIFGRVIHLSKTSVMVPPICDHIHKKMASHKSESAKSAKEKVTEKKIDKCSKLKVVDKNINEQNCEKNINNLIFDKNTNNQNCDLTQNSETFKIAATNSVEVVYVPPVDINEETSKTTEDDEINEILKLMGINDDATPKSVINDTKLENTFLNNHDVKNLPSQEETVENFFKLIGVKDDDINPEQEAGICGAVSKEGDKKIKLKICAYCKKKETRRKMFKKCSKCKEENFPIQHYYCSQDCLIEDWLESHEEEHLKYKKSSY